MRARVLIRPKPGILDPQGQAVERALPALGFTGAREVRIGRLIELEVDDPSLLPEMCERLLANTLIEEYEIVAPEQMVASGGPEQVVASRAPEQVVAARAAEAPR